MEGDGEVQEYYSMSLKYLQAAVGSLSDELYEPAMANGIHALELAMKAALHLVVEGTIKTHNIGGLFGKHFRERLGEEICRSANLILTKYNLEDLLPDLTSHQFYRGRMYRPRGTT